MFTSDGKDISLPLDEDLEGGAGLVGCVQTRPLAATVFLARIMSSSSESSK